MIDSNMHSLYTQRRTMATRLTETAYQTRKVINWGILMVICYLILRFFWGVLLTFLLIIFPPKPPVPTNIFGKLPQIKYPVAEAKVTDYNLQLETIEGRVPTASPSATVYFMPKSPANLLALTRASEFAKKLNLNPNPVQESKNIYRFDDPELVDRYMKFDIVSDNFILRYQYENDTGVFLERGLPPIETAKADAKNILQTNNLAVDDLVKGGTVKVSYFKLVGNQLVETSSLSQADAVRIDYFRRAVGGVVTLTPNPAEGAISFIYSGAKNTKKRLLQFAYTYWPVDMETKGTYALKDSTAAWEEFKSGKGYIARKPNNDTKDVVVRRVYIAYYDSLEPQLYMQPIFVFEGDNGFLGYLQAVTSEWVEENENK